MPNTLAKLRRMPLVGQLAPRTGGPGRRGRAPRARSSCGGRRSPTMTFSSADISGKSRMFWNVRAMPSWLILCGLVPAISWPLKRIVPDGRRVDAGHRVEAGGLAGTVGADQAEDLAPLDLEVDVVERDDAAEAEGDVVDLEQDLAHGAGRLEGDDVVVGGVRRAPRRPSMALCSDICGSLLGLVLVGLRILCGSSSARHQALRTEDHHQRPARRRRRTGATPGTHGTARAGR